MNVTAVDTVSTLVYGLFHDIINSGPCKIGLLILDADLGEMSAFLASPISTNT